MLKTTALGAVFLPWSYLC